MKKQIQAIYLVLLLISAAFVSCGKKNYIKADYAVVPLPNEIITPGSSTGFVLKQSTKIQYPQGNDIQKKNAEFLALYLNQLTGLKLDITYENVPENVIILKNDYQADRKESYKLTAEPKKIVINGSDEAGTFYGIQTLRKSIADISSSGKEIFFPAIEINDYPRFEYRGMHLDVARHMYTLEEIKTFVDIIALHNINRFHWHLTDDQGWRIEIKGYPELTEIGAYRDETVIGRNSGKYDGKPYGGYYTQEEIKEVIKYAQERHITIIPEVDLPGHMVAALAAYPELGCTGGPYKVLGEWGVFDDVLCAGNDSIFSFLEDVYTEVMDLFPSEIIHVGGDECPKTKWKKCPKCQARIKELGIKGDEHHTAEEYLQSYVIQRMEKFINSKGRKILGWDEILEGGIAPNASIMSWRGIEGGIIAARQGHDVVMVPTSHLYFDYYQARNTEDELFAIGGYVPVEKVYSFEPLPKELTPEEQKHIIGVQANLWSEYITGGGKHMQYMLLPRMGALSEVQWTNPDKKEYSDFLKREFRLTDLYDKLGYNYAKHIFDLNAEIKADYGNKQIEVIFSTPDNAPVYYTLDGSDPTPRSKAYTEPIIIKESTTLKAFAKRNKKSSKIYAKSFNINKASFQNIALENPPVPRYTFDGAQILVDGMKGSGVYRSGEWLGFWRDDFIAVVDLEKKTNISEVVIGTFSQVQDWVFPPTEMIVSVSEDGEQYKNVFSEQYADVLPSQQKEIINLKASFSPVEARFVKITAKTLKSLPEWHKGKGKPANLFIDEIEIN